MQATIARDALFRKRTIIFGCGYVGGEVARRLRAAGAEVIGLTRNEATAAELRKDGIVVIVADLADSNWHAQLRGHFDLVVNTVSAGGGGLAGYERSYIAGMKSVLAWAATVEVDTFIYTSSTSVYPQGGGARIDETADTDGAGERGALVRQSELVLTEGARAAGIKRWFVMRLAGIYGPGRHHILDQVCAGAVAGPWSQRLNLIHRDDAVGAILASAAATNEVKDRIYNVADAVADGAAFTIAPTKADVVLWLADRLGLAVPQESGAANGRRPATPDRVICSSAIRRELGWQPQYPTFREGYDAFLSLRGPEPR